MKVSILISAVFLSNFLLGCASTPTKSLLEERAGYGVAPPNVNLSSAGPTKYVPTRVPEIVIVPWLHDKPLSKTEYFWGGWLSVVVAGETWQMKAVEVPKSIKGKAPRTTNKPRPRNSKEAPGKAS